MIKFTPELRAYIDAELEKADEEIKRGEFHTLEESMRIVEERLQELYEQDKVETKNFARSN